MKRRHLTLCIALLAALVYAACQTVPVTGRRQLSLISSSQLQAMSLDAYGEFLADHEVIKGTTEALMVEEVGRRISRAVETYLARNDLSTEGLAWEFNLIREDKVNAWAMPGGKVAVYEGILPVAQDEAGVAVIMSHEIAHVIAGHGNERMSQGLLTELGGVALSAALSDKPQETRDLYMTAYGVGAQVGVLLPYSRLHESEADHLGLIFMAMAGFDPGEAVAFWQRMAEAKSGASLPEFLSTHPSDRTRIDQIRSLVPEARTYADETR